MANLKEFFERFTTISGESLSFEPVIKLSLPINISPDTAVVESAVNLSEVFASKSISSQ